MTRRPTESERLQRLEDAGKGLEDLRTSISRLTRLPKILVVDDCDADRDLFRGELEKVGSFEVVEAADGQDALNIFGQQPFDTVFLDIKMPGMSGLDTLKLLPTRNIVIMVTGIEENAAELMEAFNLGAVMVLTKPVKAEDLKKIFIGVNCCYESRS